MSKGKSAASPAISGLHSFNFINFPQRHPLNQKLRERAKRKPERLEIQAAD